MIEQGAYVVHKQRIKKFGYLLLIGEIQGTLKRYPFNELALVQVNVVWSVRTKHLLGASGQF